MIQIIYASASGNTEIVAETIRDVLRDNDIDYEIGRAEQTSEKTILESDLFLFATSTWEHGVINPHFNKVVDIIKHHQMIGKRAAFVGTGDTRYERVKFCGGMKMLRELFIEQNGRELINPLMIDGDVYGVLDTKVTEWAQELVENLTKLEKDES